MTTSGYGVAHVPGDFSVSAFFLDWLLIDDLDVKIDISDMSTEYMRFSRASKKWNKGERDAA